MKRKISVNEGKLIYITDIDKICLSGYSKGITIFLQAIQREYPDYTDIYYYPSATDSEIFHIYGLKPYN